MSSCNGLAGPQIPRFFAGRAVFITGASGFMGQVLVERLLSTCPDIERLFLLLRRKKDSSPEERLQQLKDSQIFDDLRKKNPSQLDKLSAVAGDITSAHLGLEPSSVALMANVSIVFHSAATLKFDEPLPAAVQQNVTSVVRVLELCDALPRIQGFVYLSTAYSNAELNEVEERVYPAPAPLHALVDAAAQLKADDTQQFIAPKPNTYTFTKAMAESALQAHGGKHYPIAIFRPTIVVSALRHPYPGWVQNLNGPSGVVVGAGKGLLHVLRCRGAARADMLPVDIAIDTLIAVAWETVIDRSPEVRVYNCSSCENPTTWHAFEAAIRSNLRRHPMDGALWCPSGIIIENRYLHLVLETFLQTIPLYVAEYVMSFLGVKTRPNLITVSSRLQAMNSVLAFFSQREWHFHTANVRALRRRLTSHDATLYNLDPHSINWDELYENFVKGSRRYLLKEKDEDIPKAKQHMRKMTILHYGTLLVGFLLLIRLAMQNAYFYALVQGIFRLLTSLYNAVFRKVM